MNTGIPLSYNPIDFKALNKLLANYQDSDHHALITDFEKKLQEITGAKYVIAVNSGTAAIHLGLRALGVGPGDQVLTSTFTYVASVNPILYLGAIPVFIDSEPETWNMDPQLLENALKQSMAKGKKPKAILLVHAYGMPARMNEIMRIASQYNIPVVEDAAEALGSSYGKKHLGSIGEVGTLSFNNNKIVTTYGGGALLTNNATIAGKALFWSTHSRENLPYYQHSELGFNYRMGPINAAAGLCGLQRLNDKVLMRRKIFEQYKSEMSHLIDSFQFETEDYFSNRWLSTFTMKSKIVSHNTAKISAKVEVRPLWNPMHLQPLYKNYSSYINSVSERLFEYGVCLPSGYMLSDEELGQIIDLMRGPVG